ncbi:hypothetical protein [Clostridium formicaceticum]|uniref:Twitching motility protein PilT n=1 Tax=Clostridium formicaceticum TaxID=1497 RepID=A0AAC9RK99_9CLOT|nr:hypothetical protein [Clostridium formicaceticum]AOY78096.1 hypothetical protein BJL90_20875 [Clostridium formicaceticum]ARE88746.1 hypothetical protein CLFO_31520 [Clostridium formicaceticum]
MIKLVLGKKGSGKTRALIQDANDSVKRTKGHIVFIDIDNSHMFQIDYKIRFMPLKDYKVKDEESFYGFLCGIIASNYDVESIYIDDLCKITEKPLEDMESFFNKLSVLEIKYNVSFIFSISRTEENLPSFLKKYIRQNT